MSQFRNDPRREQSGKRTSESMADSRIVMSAVEELGTYEGVRAIIEALQMLLVTYDSVQRIGDFQWLS